MKGCSLLTGIDSLSEAYPWEGFLSSLSDYLVIEYESLIEVYLANHNMPHSAFRHQDNSRVEPIKAIDTDYDDIAKRAADYALQAIYGIKPPPVTTPGGPAADALLSASVANASNAPAVPFPTQSAPTSVLYERARLVAASKNNPGTPVSRRPGLSQRRPWSTEEENALMAGLDAVRGPHWSQILALYGTNGQISDVLRDRNQVQLKDKARNLKMFFLKGCIEVPYYLQSVTGDLRTRGPGQAARKEAEKRARREGTGLSNPDAMAGELDDSVDIGDSSLHDESELAGLLEGEDTDTEIFDPASAETALASHDISGVQEHQSEELRTVVD